MNLEDFLNEKNIIDLSFFNFRNAITAAYFADKDLKLLRVNNNFKNSILHFERKCLLKINHKNDKKYSKMIKIPRI